MRDHALLVVVIAALFAVPACKTTASSSTSEEAKVPEDKKAYVGEWEGEGTTLTFAEDGKVSFEKKKGATSKTLNGKLSKFDGNDIKVRVLVADMTIEVQSPPKQEDGVWKMKAEGVELTRKGGAAGKASGPLKEQYEKGIRGEYELKGLTVKSVSCPVEANTQPTFKCQLTPKDGDPVDLEMTVERGKWRAKPLGVAALDKKKVEEGIVADMASHDITATVSCGDDKLLLKTVGTKFQCDAKITKPKAKEIKVDVEVKTGEGSVGFHYKA